LHIYFPEQVLSEARVVNDVGIPASPIRIVRWHPFEIIQLTRDNSGGGRVDGDMIALIIILIVIIVIIVIIIIIIITIVIIVVIIVVLDGEPNSVS
jgi:hypothetical protein